MEGIKAGDLRLNNWILDKYGKEGFVTGIRGNGYVMIHERQRLHPVNFCNGIPLSEEWLKKFGFEKREDTQTDKIVIWTDDRIWFNSYPKLLHPGEDYIWLRRFYSPTQRIMYVHQLMNLYHALTGTELTIN